jgi:hypothetical protein
MLQGQPGFERRSEIQDELKSKYTYCVYLEKKIFIAAPMIVMQTIMDDNARARRHDRAYARMKPTKNELMQATETVTFSDIPSWTKSMILR